MAVTNILIVTFSSISREYIHIEHIKPRQGTKLHLEWLHYYVNIFSPSTYPLLEKLSTYHYTFGLLLNVLAHIPWMLLILFLQGLSVFTMSIYYKKFHPWKTIINTANVNKTTTVQDFFSNRNEVLEEESEIEWVDEDLMECDTDTDEEEVSVIVHVLEEEDGIEIGEKDVHQEDEEQYELQEIVQHSSTRYKLERDRSILMKYLNMQQKKREYSRRKFFSEMTRTKSNDQKAAEDSLLIKSNEVKIQVQVRQTEAIKEAESNEIEEPYEFQKVTHRGDDNHSADEALDFVNIIIQEDKHSNPNFCREILDDLIDRASTVNEDVTQVFMEEIEVNNQHLCKDIILQLVCDAVAKANK